MDYSGPKLTDMIFKYKVSLPNIKGFARIYEVKDTTSLYFFHKQMRADMDFPQDQIVLFKALDSDGKAIARYSVVDMGSGTIDDVTLAQCHANGQDSFVYFYDTTNRKSVLLDFIDEVGKAEPGKVYPILTESKGPNPIEFENGYVAFEDLPDEKKRKASDDDEDWDDDDDDDEEDDDEEDGEEIYDGEEDD